MSKKRYINTTLWRDEYIASLDPSEKLLFIYLLTCPDTTIAGIDFRDECALRVMQADWSSNGIANLAFSIETTDASLKTWATLYYRMADAMLEARKK